MAERFEDLRVWQAARTLTNDIYAATRGDRFSRDFGLRDQIQRAAVSVMANIAEGFESRTNRPFIQYLGQAKASAGEVRCQLYVAKDQGYLTDPDFTDMYDRADHITRPGVPPDQTPRSVDPKLPHQRTPRQLPETFVTLSA
jgi:four helix bundle protein